MEPVHHRGSRWGRFALAAGTNSGVNTWVIKHVEQGISWKSGGSVASFKLTRRRN